MRWLLVLLAGCDRLLQLETIRVHDAGGDATSDGASPAAMLVQEKTASNNAAASVSIVLGHQPANGDVLVFVGGSEAGIMAPTGGGASWQMAAHSLVKADLDIWFGVSDGSSTTVTITARGLSTIWGNVSEWSGLATPGTFDAMDSKGGQSGPANLSAQTTSAPDLIVFGVGCYADPALVDPPAEWAELLPTGSNATAQRVWYRISTAAGAQTANATCSVGWDAGLAAFKLAP